MLPRILDSETDLLNGLSVDKKRNTNETKLQICRLAEDRFPSSSPRPSPKFPDHLAQMKMFGYMYVRKYLHI